MKTKMITVHEALNFKWQQEPAYIGYVPEQGTWQDVAKTFTQNGHNVSNPLRLGVIRDGKSMMIDVCEFKIKGELLPNSKQIPPEAQFAMCVIADNNQRVAITF